MTVSSETTTAGPYLGNGSTTGFTFSFYAQSANDITVTLDDVVTTAYSISFNSNNLGGTVTMDAAPGSDVEVFIYLDITTDQQTVFANSGYSTAQASAAQTVADRAAQQILQVERAAIRLPPAGLALAFDPVLPTPVANGYLRTNADGDGWELANSSGAAVSASSNVLYATSYGCVADDTTDNAAKLALLMTQATALNGRHIYFPAGTGGAAYLTNSTWEIKASGIDLTEESSSEDLHFSQTAHCTIEGSGDAVLTANAAMDYLIKVTYDATESDIAPYFTKLANLRLEGGTNATAVVYSDFASKLSLERVRIRSTKTSGIGLHLSGAGHCTLGEHCPIKADVCIKIENGGDHILEELELYPKVYGVHAKYYSGNSRLSGGTINDDNAGVSDTPYGIYFDGDTSGTEEIRDWKVTGVEFSGLNYAAYGVKDAGSRNVYDIEFTDCHVKGGVRSGWDGTVFHWDNVDNVTTHRLRINSRNYTASDGSTASIYATGCKSHTYDLIAENTTQRVCHFVSCDRMTVRLKAQDVAQSASEIIYLDACTNCTIVVVDVNQTSSAYAQTIVRETGACSGNRVIFEGTCNVSLPTEMVSVDVAMQDAAPPIFPNGAFQVWQSGAGAFTADGYTADQVLLDDGTGATNSVSRVAGLRETAEYALEWVYTASGSDLSQLDFIIEDVRNFAGRSVIVEFDADASVALSSRVVVVQEFGSGGSTAVSTNGPLIAFGTDLKRYGARIDVPSISGKTIGTDHFLRVRFRRSDTTTNGTLTFGDLDAHEGYGPRPFYRLPREEAELRCKRYYERIGTEDLFQQFGHAFANTTSEGVGSLYFTPKRKTPTIGTNGNFQTQRAGTADAVSSVTPDRIGLRSARLVLGYGGTPLTAGDALLLQANNDATAYFEINARY